MENRCTSMQKVENTINQGLFFWEGGEKERERGHIIAN